MPFSEVPINEALRTIDWVMDMIWLMLASGCLAAKAALFIIWLYDHRKRG